MRRRGRPRRSGRRPVGTGRATPQHLGKLDDPALAIEALDLGDRATVALALRDAELGIGVGGDLGQVRDAQDLVAAGQGPEAPADRVGAPAADARIDLVEHERRRLVGLGEDLLDRERDPGQFAARRDPGECPGRLARVRGQSIDDLVDPRGIERDRVAVELHRRLRGTGDPSAQGDLEHALGEAQVPERRADGGGHRARGRATGPGQGVGRSPDLAEQAGIVGIASRAFAIEPVQALGLGLGTFAVGDDRGLAVAIPSFERVDRPEALLERGDRGRIVLDGLGERACLGGHIGQLRLQARQPLSQRFVPRVHPCDDPRLAQGDRDPIARSPTLGGQGLVDGRRAARDGLPVLGGRQPGADLVGLAGAQLRRRDLPRLVLEELEAAGELTGIADELGEGGPVGPPRLHGVGHGRPQALVPPEPVEEVALPALVEEPLLVVLAVDLDERPTSSARRAAVTVSSSTRAVERPLAATSRTAMSGSGRRSKSASTRAVSAPCRTSDVSARAPSASPSASMIRLLPAPVSPVRTLKPGSSESRRRSMSARSVTASSSSRPVTTAAGRPCGAAGPRRAARPSVR